MTTVLIEFAGSDGRVLRNLDAGFEYIDAADIPWANAERPLRVATATSLFSEPIPLPDGKATRVRVAAKGLVIENDSTTLKTRVLIDGMAYELTVKVMTELRQLAPEDRPATTSSMIRQPEPDARATTSRSEPESMCPRCGSHLVRKRITVGNQVRQFWGCGGWPDCTYSQSIW